MFVETLQGRLFLLPKRLLIINSVSKIIVLFEFLPAFERLITNPFVPNAPFRYPLKTSENLTAS